MTELNEVKRGGERSDSTPYPYIPDLPYVVSNGGVVVARFFNPNIAREFRESRRFKNDYEIIDTTPKPRVPEDATFITWWSKDTRWYAEMCSGTWRVGRDSLFEAVEDLPGVTPETVFTVLEERKS